MHAVVVTLINLFKFLLPLETLTCTRTKQMLEPEGVLEKSLGLAASKLLSSL